MNEAYDLGENVRTHMNIHAHVLKHNKIGNHIDIFLSVVTKICVNIISYFYTQIITVTHVLSITITLRYV